MPDFNAWAEAVDPLDVAEDRAVIEWRHILDLPTRITIRRANSPVTAQQVRIEFSSGGTEIGTDQPRATGMSATVFGIRNHPLVADTDIQIDDRFVVEDQEFEVIGVIPYPGGIQAYCEVHG